MAVTLSVYQCIIQTLKSIKTLCETMKRACGCKYQHYKPELSKNHYLTHGDNLQVSTNYLKLHIKPVVSLSFGSTTCRVTDETARLVLVKPIEQSPVIFYITDHSKAVLLI